MREFQNGHTNCFSKFDSEKPVCTENITLFIRSLLVSGNCLPGASMSDFERDLLGDPTRSGHGLRGRPRHLAVDDNRTIVATLSVLGWTQARIALAIGVNELGRAVPTGGGGIRKCENSYPPAKHTELTHKTNFLPGKFEHSSLIKAIKHD